MKTFLTGLLFLDCKICTSVFNIEQFNDENVFGYFSRINLFELNRFEKELFLHFEKQDDNTQTLVIRLKDEQFTEEVLVNLKFIGFFFIMH